jgi:ribonuclease HI
MSETTIDSVAGKIISFIEVGETKKSKKVIKPPPASTDPFTHAVLYTDGSAKPFPSPGVSAYGVHGYIYKNDIPKKGISVNATAYMYRGKNEEESSDAKHAQGSKVKITNKGYQPKLSEDILEVTPVSYVNICGGFPVPVTNNVAELAGIHNALIYAKEKDLKHVSIYSDSEYAIRALTGYVNQWSSNNWIKRDGSQVKNKEYFIPIMDLEKQLVSKGTTIKYNWIKGHNGDLGNESADAIADLGTKKSINGQIDKTVVEVNADDYWIKKVDKNPLLYQTGMFILDNPDSMESDELFTIDNVKEYNLYGKAATEATYCFLKLKDIDPAIITIREAQQNTMLNTGALAICDLNILFRPNTAMYLRDYGVTALNRTNHKFYGLSLPDGGKITEELNPPLKASKAVNAISTLKQVYDEIIVKNKSDDSISITDITNQLYFEKDGKLILNEKIENGYHKLSIDIMLPKSMDSKTIMLSMITGTDLPDRNVLKRLEETNVKISVIVLKESKNAYRFFTYIKTDVGESIVSAFHGNIRFI